MTRNGLVAGPKRRRRLEGELNAVAESAIVIRFLAAIAREAHPEDSGLARSLDPQRRGPSDN